jgi:hypothetical protein
MSHTVSNGRFKFPGRSWIIFALGSALLCLPLFFLLTSPIRQPTYRGRPLTSWLEQYSTNHFVRRGSDADKEAEHAIREIGTNAIPSLLTLLRSDSGLAKKVARSLPRRIASRIYLDDHLRLASHGFVALGTNASPALPHLIALSKDHDRDVRYSATYSLGHLGTAAEPAIPRLIELTDDAVGSIRDQALISLSMIRGKPPLVVPVLIRCAVAPERSIPERTAAIRGLRYYKDAAPEILPVLLKLQEDADPNIREDATNSVRWLPPHEIAN